jgi:Predicted integral membrane protein
MKHPDYVKELLLLLLVFVPMVYLGLIWNSLPEIIPTNYNLNGVPDRVGDKQEFLLLMIFLFFTNGLLYFLFRYIPKPDGQEEPATETANHIKTYYRIRFRIHIYLAVFTTIIIYLVSVGRGIFLEKWVFIGVGLLISMIGLVLRNLKPNNFVGVRTPWTMQSNEIWLKVHAFAGKLWLYAGIVIIIAGMFLTVVSGVFMFIFAAMALAALPYIYSYRLFYVTHG